jgi:hypothetical protein
MSNVVRQANRTAYIKLFPTSQTSSVNWVYKTTLDPSGSNMVQYITPSTINSVYLPKNLVVQGTILNPSDKALKENINDLEDEFCDNILKITPKKYNFINDENKKEHYGIIAQDLADFFPELVVNSIINDDTEIKTVNYLELIPIMILKMQNMQKEIDKLSLLMP